MQNLDRKFNDFTKNKEKNEENEIEENEEINENREKLLNLPLKNFKKLLERNDLNVRTEDVVLELVIDYIKMRETFEEKSDENDELSLQGEVYDLKKIFTKKYYKEEINKEEYDSDTDLNDSQENETKESQEKITFDFNWNFRSNKHLKNFKLSSDEKRDLLKIVRLSYVTHPFLVKITKEPILIEFMDLILEAMSMKLSLFEASNMDYSINSKPRNRYIKAKQQENGKIKVFFYIIK